MSSEPRRALVIAHEPDCRAKQIEVRLAERGFSVDTHVVTLDGERPNEAEPWPQVEGYDLIVPMGSVRSLTNKAEIDSWIHDELALLRELHEQDVPIFGVCFGAQLLADALGGSVEKAPVTEIGWFEIEAPPGVINPAGPGPWKEWHHDRVTPPPGAEVLAVNENAVQLFQLGRSVATQFHPEVDVEHLSTWLGECPTDYLAENNVTAEGILADAIEHEERNIKQCHALIDWYLDEVAFADYSTSPDHRRKRRS